MKDEEIVEALKRADSLLGAYRELLQPVLDELADRKSNHVFGVPGKYKGELGCYEEGADSLCLHIKEIQWFYDIPYEDQKAHSTKAYQFEDEWRAKAGLKHIFIRGHH